VNISGGGGDRTRPPAPKQAHWGDFLFDRDASWRQRPARSVSAAV